MLQRLAAWCYRRRRSVVVLWIVALVAVSVIGSNVGAVLLPGVLPHRHRVGARRAAARDAVPGPCRRRGPDRLRPRRRRAGRGRAGPHGGALRRGRQGARRHLGRQPVHARTAPARSRAAVTSRTPPCSSTTPRPRSPTPPSSTSAPSRTTPPVAACGSRSVGACSRSRAGSARPSSSASSPPSSSCSSRSGRCSRWGCPILIALFGIGIGLGLVQLLSHTIATPDFATAARVDDRHRRRHRLRAVHRHPVPPGPRRRAPARARRRARHRHRGPRRRVRRHHRGDLAPRSVPDGRRLRERHGASARRSPSPS